MVVVDKAGGHATQLKRESKLGDAIARRRYGLQRSARMHAVAIAAGQLPGVPEDQHYLGAGVSRSY